MFVKSSHVETNARNTLNKKKNQTEYHYISHRNVVALHVYIHTHTRVHIYTHTHLQKESTRFTS